MWLTTPATIEHVLVERTLEPVSDEALDQSAREWRDRGEKLAPREALRSMPVVSIGRPETWPLPALYSPRKMPRPIRAMLGQADFYLVRLSCSFRPLHTESRVEWARFRATLLPHPATGAQPLAFDLYPQVVDQEVQRQTKVTFSPLLKFQELEASIGSLEVGFDYTEKRPRISAAIGAGFDPSWDYRAVLGNEVQGTKWMYLLLKVPKGMAAGKALLDLDADLIIRNSRLPAVIWRQQEQATAQLTAPLWG